LAAVAIPRASGYKDTMSGCFIARREALSGLQLNPRSFKVLLEVLAKGRYGKVVEVPYFFEPRRKGHSKLGPGEMWTYLRHLARLSYETGGYLTFFRFCLVGLSGVFVNEAVFWVSSVPLRVHYLASGAISAEVAIVNNFTWNDRWTFADKSASHSALSLPGRFLRFNVSMIGGVIISLGVLYLLASFLGVNPLISNLVAIVCSTLWNFTASAKLVWD
jgi:dolichol-phosphate mannosyltransferase